MCSDTRNTTATVKDWRKEHVPTLGRNSCFPRKVHQTLLYASTNNLENIIHWNADGTGFHVSDPDEFMEEIAPLFFPNQKRFRSFERLLNLWGFEREKSARSSSRSLWSNPHFRRDRPDLCKHMVRIENKGQRKRVPMANNQYGFVYLNQPTSSKQQQKPSLEFVPGEKSKKSESHGNRTDEKDVTKHLPLKKRVKFSEERTTHSSDTIAAPSPWEREQPIQKVIKPIDDPPKQDEGIRILDAEEICNRVLLKFAGNRKASAEPREIFQGHELKPCDGKVPSTSQSCQGDHGSHDLRKWWLKIQSIYFPTNRGNNSSVSQEIKSGERETPQAKSVKKGRQTFARRRYLPTNARSERLPLREVVACRENSSHHNRIFLKTANRDSSTLDLIKARKAFDRGITSLLHKVDVNMMRPEKPLQSSGKCQIWPHTDGQFDDADEDKEQFRKRA